MSIFGYLAIAFLLSVIITILVWAVGGIDRAIDRAIDKKDQP